MSRIRVGLIFGGRSVEHEISLRSAKNILENMDQEKFDPFLIGINKQGTWHKMDAVSTDFDPERILSMELNPGHLVLKTKDSSFQIDVAFPILHGTDGEDGSIQGFLTCMGIPFVGSGVLGSAMAMNKQVTKTLLSSAGLPVANGIQISKNDYDIAAIQKLGLPIIVKPSNLGSSVGVSKVSSWEDLKNAIEYGFQFDHDLLIEEFITGREMECAVFGNKPPMASLPGEIIIKGDHEVYSYEAKYTDEEGSEILIPAKVDNETAEQIKKICTKAYEATYCNDLARIDFFLTDANQIVINEINTIPGFTSISMYPKLCELMGIGYQELISRLISEAILRNEASSKLETNFIPNS